MSEPDNEEKLAAMRAALDTIKKEGVNAAKEKHPEAYLLGMILAVAFEADEAGVSEETLLDSVRYHVAGMYAAGSRARKAEGH